MPLYEFACKNCGEKFELLVPASERNEPQECPACGKKASDRLMSSFATGKSVGASCSTSSGG